MSRRARPARLALVALAAVLFGCAQREESRAGPLPTPAPVPECSCAPGAPVVDPTLLAFLSKARSIHHEADLAEDAGERARAVTVLEQLVATAHPGGSAPPPEVTEVLADTRARLADLRSGLGAFDAAAKDIDEGLKLAPTPTHFRGHLFEVRGLVEERREKALKASGNQAEARRAREAAIAAFDQAVSIQDDVIARALSDAGAPSGK